MASTPEGESDAWVNVSVEGKRVIANSLSCWVVRLDLETGAEVDRRFTN
jgi:hypothetical protein